MNEVLQRLTGEELLVLAVLNGDAVYEVIEAELDRRALAARASRTHRIRLGTRDLVAAQPRARRSAAVATAA